MYRGHEPSNSELKMRDYASMKADLIIVDESNSFSENGRSDRKYLTVVCSRTTDYGRFADIADTIPSVRGKRKKHSSMSVPEIEKVVSEIEKYTETDFVITEEHRYIDYSALRDAKAKQLFYMGVLRKAVEKSVELGPDRAMIVILDNPPLDIIEQLQSFGIELSRNCNIVWFETRLSSGTRVLQTQDIITGIVANHVESKVERNGLYDRLARYMKK